MSMMINRLFAQLDVPIEAAIDRCIKIGERPLAIQMTSDDADVLARCVVERAAHGLAFAVPHESYGALHRTGNVQGRLSANGRLTVLFVAADPQ